MWHKKIVTESALNFMLETPHMKREKNQHVCSYCASGVLQIARIPRSDNRESPPQIQMFVAVLKLTCERPRATG